MEVLETLKKSVQRLAKNTTACKAQEETVERRFTDLHIDTELLTRVRKAKKVLQVPQVVG